MTKGSKTTSPSAKSGGLPPGGTIETCPYAKKFKTPQEAAVAAMKEANPGSVAQGREYGGWVRKNSDGTYSYDAPVKGSEAGMDTMPDQGSNGVEWYHTHGENTPGYDNENFSGDDGDKGYSKSTNSVGYVATPSGVIKKYDPATNTETTLPDKAPIK